MPITVEMIKDNTIVVQTYSDPVDMKQMYDLKDQMARNILASAAHKLHIIADFSQVKNLPGMILSRGAFMLSNAHPNTGVVIIVTKDSFVTRMAQIFARLSPKQEIRVTASLEEAIEIAEHYQRAAQP